MEQNSLQSLKEDKAFEHFAGYLVTTAHYGESFSTDDIAVGIHIVSFCIAPHDQIDIFRPPSRRRIVEETLWVAVSEVPTPFQNRGPDLTIMNYSFISRELRPFWKEITYPKPELPYFLGLKAR